MSGGLDEVSLKIGGLEAGVKSISHAMSAHSTLHSENHSKLTSKIDDLTTVVAQLVTKVEQTDKDVGSLKPAVDKLNAARNRMLGIITVGTFLVSGSINLAIGYFKT